LLQSYEKSSAKQRNSFLFLPRQSKFAISDGKVMRKVERKTKKIILYFAFRSVCTIFGFVENRLHLENENKSKFILHFARFALSLQAI